MTSVTPFPTTFHKPPLELLRYRVGFVIGGGPRTPRFSPAQSTKALIPNGLMRSPCCRSAPNFVRELDDHPQFRPLLVLGERIAFFRRGKSALRRQAKLIQRGKFGRLVDTALDVVLLFQLAALGGDKTQHDDLVALRQEPQRLEAARARGIVFEEIAVVVQLIEQNFGNRLVTALRNPGRTEIAAANVGRDYHVGGF